MSRLVSTAWSIPVRKVAMVAFAVSRPKKKSLDYTRLSLIIKLKAGDGDRTRNLQLGKLLRYHCATPAHAVR